MSMSNLLKNKLLPVPAESAWSDLTPKTVQLLKQNGFHIGAFGDVMWHGFVNGKATRLHIIDRNLNKVQPQGPAKTHEQLFTMFHKIIKRST